MCLPPHLLKYTTHLLRCCAQINPQRIKDTPAVNLCSRLVSTLSISKGLRQVHLRCRSFSEVHPCTSLNTSLTIVKLASA